VSSAETEFADQIAQRARQVVLERLRAAFDHQVAKRPPTIALDSVRLEQFVADAAQRAGEALWRRSLAQAVIEHLDVDLPEALAHPVLAAAQARAHAPESAPRPASTTSAPAESGESSRLAGDQSQDLRLGAVHLIGIETLRPGDRDIEVRLSDAGLDVLKRSSGAAIGRLEWSEIDAIELPSPRRVLRGRRRPRELHVSTERGQAQFELPGLTEDELHQRVEPMLARLRRSEAPASDTAPPDQSS
jgi:hypothetical protein